MKYDNRGNVIEVAQRDGNATGNLVAKRRYFFNPWGLMCDEVWDEVDPVTGAVGPALEGQRTYNPSGNLLRSHEPGGAYISTWRTYDNLGRMISVDVGSMLAGVPEPVVLIVEKKEFTFDEASNVIAIAESKLDAGSLPPSPTYRVSYAQTWFDPMGRQVAAANLGALSSAATRPDTPPARSDTVLVVDYAYDDAGEVWAEIDPLGRENRAEYDDKGRRTRTIENYVSPGAPSMPDTGSNRTMEFSYTADDQLSQLTVRGFYSGGVDFSQITRWEYGFEPGSSSFYSNKLLARKVYADGTADVFGYNRQSEKTLQADANGTVRELIYDGLGRLKHDCAVALGHQVYSPIRRQTFGYNKVGLPASLQAHSNPDPEFPTAINEVALEYDGYGELIRHFQEHYGKVVFEGTGASKAVVYERGGNNQDRVEKIIYPAGQEFEIGYVEEEPIGSYMGRATTISEVLTSGSEEIVRYGYLGMNTVVTKELTGTTPQVSLDLWGGVAGTYAGLDRFGRVIDQKWKVEGEEDIVRLQYGYDRGSRRTYRRDLAAIFFEKELDELYSYDGLSQLLTLKRGLLNTAGTALEEDTENFNETWEYDAIGNWLRYNQGDPEVVLDQFREHNNVNEIAKIYGDEGGGWPKPRYNATGNTTRIPGGEDPTKPFRVDYDAWNRITRVFTFDSLWNSIRVAKYHYDARGWRVQNEVFVVGGESGSILQNTIDYYYDENWRVLEEWTTQAPTPPPEGETEWTYFPAKFHQRYLWDVYDGAYPDSLILRDRDTTGDGIPDERRFALQDAHYNVVALCGSTGVTATALERFNYSGFGNPGFFNGGFEPATGSDDKWNILFSGYMHDFWVEIYCARYRYYHSKLGRWMSRDPIGEIGGINLFGISENSPVNYSDAFGLATGTIECKWDLILGHASTGGLEGAANWWDSRPKGGYPGEGCGNAKIGFATCNSNLLSSYMPSENQIPIDLPSGGDPYPRDAYDRFRKKKRKRKSLNHAPEPAYEDMVPHSVSSEDVFNAIEQVISEAERQCGLPENCCKSITIKITCSDPSISSHLISTGHSDPCGTDVYIPC